MFRELFDAAPHPLIASDDAGCIVHANREAENLFGYAPDALRGSPMRRLIPQWAQLRGKPAHPGSTVSARAASMEIAGGFAARRRSGETFPVRIGLKSLDTPRGRLHLVSMRAQAEIPQPGEARARERYDAVAIQLQRLTAAASTVDAVIEHVPEAIAGALAVPAGAITRRNPYRRTHTIEAAYGLSERLLDITLYENDARVLGQPGVAEEAPVIAGSRLDDPTSYECQSFAAEGFRAAAWIPLLDGRSVAGLLLILLRGSVSFGHDATHFLQSVAHLIGSAIRRLRAEYQLAQSQRLEIVGQLAGGIAHDFNNFLTIISGNLEILASLLADHPSGRDVLRHALNAVGRGAELSTKLLAFARRQPLAPIACDPRRLLEEIGGMLGQALGPAIELRMVCSPDTPAVYADPALLEAALVNLVLNSRDAMPRGGPLTIATFRHHQRPGDLPANLIEGDYVVFSVHDTGLGMPPDVLARAFDPLFTTKPSGTGLGLSMVYGFVRQSGGHLAAESRMGYGTTIRLYLPVAGQARTT